MHPRWRPQSLNYDLASYEALRLLNLEQEQQAPPDESTNIPATFYGLRASRNNSSPDVLGIGIGAALSNGDLSGDVTPNGSDLSICAVRRQSLRKPGIATRNSEEVRPPLVYCGGTSDTCVISRQGSFLHRDVDEDAHPPVLHQFSDNPRMMTPCEDDYKQIGDFKLGSLRITNGTASPSSFLDSPAGKKNNRRGGDITPTKKPRAEGLLARRLVKVDRHHRPYKVRPPPEEHRTWLEATSFFQPYEDVVPVIESFEVNASPKVARSGANSSGAESAKNASRVHPESAFKEVEDRDGKRSDFRIELPPESLTGVEFGPLFKENSSNEELKITSKHTAQEHDPFNDDEASDAFSTGPEVLEVRNDLLAKSLCPPETRHLKPESGKRCSKTASRCDIGFVTSATSGKASTQRSTQASALSESKLAKADSGYSSNTSLRSFKANGIHNHNENLAGRPPVPEKELPLLPLDSTLLSSQFGSVTNPTDLALTPCRSKTSPHLFVPYSPVPNQKTGEPHVTQQHANPHTSRGANLVSSSPSSLNQAKPSYGVSNTVSTCYHCEAESKKRSSRRKLLCASGLRSILSIRAIQPRVGRQAEDGYHVTGQRAPDKVLEREQKGRIKDMVADLYHIITSGGSTPGKTRPRNSNSYAPDVFHDRKRNPEEMPTNPEPQPQSKEQEQQPARAAAGAAAAVQPRCRESCHSVPPLTHIALVKEPFFASFHTYNNSNNSNNIPDYHELKLVPSFPVSQKDFRKSRLATSVGRASTIASSLAERDIHMQVAMAQSSRRSSRASSMVGNKLPQPPAQPLLAQQVRMQKVYDSSSRDRDALRLAVVAVPPPVATKGVSTLAQPSSTMTSYRHSTGTLSSRGDSFRILTRLSRENSGCGGAGHSESISRPENYHRMQPQPQPQSLDPASRTSSCASFRSSRAQDVYPQRPVILTHGSSSSSPSSSPFHFKTNNVDASFQSAAHQHQYPDCHLPPYLSPPISLSSPSSQSDLCALQPTSSFSSSSQLRRRATFDGSYAFRHADGNSIAGVSGAEYHFELQRRQRQPQPKLEGAGRFVVYSTGIDDGQVEGLERWGSGHYERTYEYGYEYECGHGDRGKMSHGSGAARRLRSGMGPPHHAPYGPANSPFLCDQHNCLMQQQGWWNGGNTTSNDAGYRALHGRGSGGERLHASGNANVIHTHRASSAGQRHQPPQYRVLHSYNSPAYRGVPIWG